MLEIQEKRFLINLARTSIKHYLNNDTLYALSQEDKRNLDEVCKIAKQDLGCFVTLKTAENELRGCIGLIIADTPLYQNIIEYGVKAATEDPRFPSVTGPEFENLKIEISIMAQVQRLENLEHIEVGTHGLIIKQGFMQGLLLPQVATEWKMDRTTFLEHTCQKAGLPKDAYLNRAATEIYYFTAEVLSEVELKSNSICP